MFTVALPSALPCHVPGTLGFTHPHISNAQKKKQSRSKHIPNSAKSRNLVKVVYQFFSEGEMYAHFCNLSGRTHCVHPRLLMLCLLVVVIYCSQERACVRKTLSAFPRSKISLPAGAGCFRRVAPCQSTENVDRVSKTSAAALCPD